MSTPLFNLMLFALICAVAALLLWPGWGLLSRGRRQRLFAKRIHLEDALKHVYDHEYRGQTATVSSVGGALQISPARTVELVERMQGAGLVTYADGRIVLTDEGNRYALQIIRAHRLWERYLADETGVDAREWHIRAEKREHTLSPEETAALAARLGNPRFDPHGDPIPTEDGLIPEETSVPLSKLEVRDTAVVAHIEDEPDVIYAQLLADGIHLGMVVRVEAKTDQRIVIAAEGRELALAPMLAANISVSPIAVEHVEGEPALDSLSSLSPGQSGRVVRISPACRGLERRRLMDLGIVPGTDIEFEREGLTGGLSAFRVRGTVVALRDEQAELIAIDTSQDSGPA